MSNPLRSVALIALLSISFAANAQSSLDKTLAAMDKASTQFHSMQSDLEWDNYERVTRDTDVQTGTFYCSRGASGGTEIGIHFTKPGEQILAYKDGVGHKYDPNLKQDDQAKSASFESFLALGCGGSGKDLAKGWTINDQGSETLTLKDGQKIVTEKLDLISKDEKTRNNASHITVWIDLTRGIAVQQIIYQPSGDTKTSYYTHIRYNQSVKTGPYEIPRGVKVVMH